MCQVLIRDYREQWGGGDLHSGSAADPWCEKMKHVEKRRTRGILYACGIEGTSGRSTSNNCAQPLN
jgi:hypothetical protein